MKATNQLKRLESRRKDFDAGRQSREGKVTLRWDTKGYHRPGSLKK